MIDFNNMFKKKVEGTPDNVPLVMTGKYEEGENKPLVTLDGEDMYMSLIETNSNDDGVMSSEKIQSMKKIMDEIKLHSKECGSQLWELYKLLEKN
jgi:hypothetical protein